MWSYFPGRAGNCRRQIAKSPSLASVGRGPRFIRATVSPAWRPTVHWRHEFDTTKLDLNNIEGTEAAVQKAWMRLDAKTQREISTGGYATAVSPVDGTVWISVPQVNGAQNKLFMLNPKTRQFKDSPLPTPLRLSHGIDFSTDGALWFSAGSGHLAKLDPKTGKFSHWDLPGPKFTGTGAETGST